MSDRDLNQAVKPAKPTGELMNELSSTANFSKYLEKNQDSFIKEPISQRLLELFDKRHVKKAVIFRAAGISEVYGYQVLAGLKRADRGKIIAILIALGLELDEINSVLKYGGYAALYVKNEADCIVIHGIMTKKKVSEINEMLYDKGLPTLT